MAKPMYVRFEMPKELVDKTYQSIELAKESGKVRKSTNEVTKLVERGEAQFVVMAEVGAVVGRTGRTCEAVQAKARVLDGRAQGRTFRRNVKGRTQLGDLLRLGQTARQARQLAVR